MFIRAFVVLLTTSLIDPPKTIWYNVVRHYTSADLQSDQREDILFGEPCTFPAGNNTGESNDHCIKLLKHGIISLISISSVGHYSIFRTRIILRRKEVYFA